MASTKAKIVWPAKWKMELLSFIARRLGVRIDIGYERLQ